MARYQHGVVKNEPFGFDGGGGGDKGGEGGGGPLLASPTTHLDAPEPNPTKARTATGRAAPLELQPLGIERVCARVDGCKDPIHTRSMRCLSVKVDEHHVSANATHVVFEERNCPSAAFTIRPWLPRPPIQYPRRVGRTKVFDERRARGARVCCLSRRHRHWDGNGSWWGAL